MTSITEWKKIWFVFRSWSFSQCGMEKPFKMFRDWHRRWHGIRWHEMISVLSMVDDFHKRPRIIDQVKQNGNSALHPFLLQMMNVPTEEIWSRTRRFEMLSSLLLCWTNSFNWQTRGERDQFSGPQWICEWCQMDDQLSKYSVKPEIVRSRNTDPASMTK